MKKTTAHGKTARKLLVCILALTMLLPLLMEPIGAAVESNQAAVAPLEAGAALQYRNLLDPPIPFLGNNPGTGTQDGITVGAGVSIGNVGGRATQRRAIEGHPYIASIFGTQGWTSGGASFTGSTDYRRAFDGDASNASHWDGYTMGHVGVEFIEPQYVARIRFHPRGTHGTNRINGAVFEGSNDDVNWVPLYTIDGLTTDVMNQWHTVGIADGLNANQAFKFFRLIDRGALTDMFNINELELWTADLDVPSADVLASINLPAEIYPNASVELPATAALGLGVSWASLTPDIMDNSGNFVWDGTALPVTATLRATLVWDTETFTRDFDVRIVMPGVEIFEPVQLPPLIYPTQTVVLPPKGAADFDLIWTSLTPDVMGVDGVVVWTGALPATARLRASVEWPDGTVAAFRDFDIVILEELTEFGFDTHVVEGMELLINLDFEEDPVNNFFVDEENGAMARARAGNSATTTTSATLAWGETPGSGRSARLSNTFHLELTKLDGSPILRGLDEFVVSYDVNPTGTGGNNLWTFVGKRTRVVQKLNFERQLSVRETTTSIEARSWYNSGTQPAPNIVPVPAGWRHVDVHFQPDRTTIYINGVEISSMPAEFPPSYITSAAGGFAYVGFMPTGQFFTGEIDNFKIWRPADPDDAGKVAAAKEALNIPFNNTCRPVRGNITLLDKGLFDTDITWTTSHPEIVDLYMHENEGYYPKLPGVINRPTDEDTVVTMTARITSGEAYAYKDFEFTVIKAMESIPGPGDFEAYLYSYFTGFESFPTDEQVYFSVSHDGVNWVDTRLRGDPVLRSTIGDQGVRDPWVIRAPEGDLFYLIATDLNINRRGGWGAAGTGDSCINIAVWESTDLVNWSDMRLVPMAGGLLGAGNAWAPEMVYDELTGEYFVFWASQTAASTSNHMMYTRTRDFHSFSQPQRWITPDVLTVAAGTITGTASTIDSTLFQQDGRWIRVSRASNRNTVDWSDDLRLTGHWTRMGNVEDHLIPGFLDTHGAIEGPQFLAYNQRDWPDPDTPLFGLFADRFGRSLGYVRLTSTNLFSMSPDYWSDEGGILSDLTEGPNLPPSVQRPTKRHGSLLPITQEEYLRVLAAFTRGADNIMTIPDDYDLIAAFGFNHMPSAGDDAFNDQTGNAKLVPGDDAEWRRSTARAPSDVGGFSVDFTDDNDSWLNLTKRDGSPLLLDENGEVFREVIITYNSRADSGVGDYGWSFFASNDAGDQEAGYERFIGISDRPGGMTINRWYNADSSAPSLTGGPALPANTWKGVVLYLGQTHTELYIDGVLAGIQEGHPTLEQILGPDGGLIQIGKGNLGEGGQFFQGQIDDLKIYALPLDAPQNQGPQPWYLRYNITATPYPMTGGTVTGAGIYDEGETVTLTATANENYEFSGWYENNVRIPGAGAVYEFTADAHRALEARFTTVDLTQEQVRERTQTRQDAIVIPDPEPPGEEEPPDVDPDREPYYDVADPDAWYYEAVYFVTDAGLMDGVGGNMFSPNTNLTRAMFVTILGRLAEQQGEVTTGFSNPFADVPAGQWYTQYVAWASSNGIVLGLSETAFAPNDPVTREQMAALMIRFCDYMEIELGDDVEFDFADADAISEWAAAFVERAAAAGLMQGVDGGRFDPIGTATRAQVAQLFTNFLTTYVNDPD